MKTILSIIILGAATLLSAQSKDRKKELDTAANAKYLTALEKEVIYEINLFRSNPQRYAEDFIAPLAKNYQNKLLHYPGEEIGIRTIEGVSALKECVEALKKAKPLGLIYPDLRLSKAARDHQKDQERTGRTGHTGSDSSDLKERIERYGNWEKRIAENIAYGNSNARQYVIFLLIDDGVKNRGHRQILLHHSFTTVGVACGKHPVYRTMCVMDFAGGMSK